MAKKILVIDDEAVITKSLSKLLTKQGYDVAVAHTFHEAMEKVEQQDFNLIVSDVRMPEGDGIETITAIREYLKKEHKPPVPEVFITGYTSEEKYKSAVDLKVAGYLYKPFDIQEFLDAVRKNIK